MTFATRRLRRQTAAWQTQALLVACISAVASCNGGPIVPGKPATGTDTAAASGPTVEKDAAIVSTLTASADACTATGKVWIPNIAGPSASDPKGTGTCGGPPVGYCCTVDALRAHVPAADAFVPKIAALTGQSYQIYACSQDDADTVTVHMIKRQAGQNFYSAVTMSQLDAGTDTGTSMAALTDGGTGSTDTSTGTASSSAAGSATDTDTDASTGSCPTNLGAILAGKPTQTAEATSTQTAFDLSVNPLLKTYCDGGGCHAKGSQSPTGYVDSPDAVKANVKPMLDDIQSGRMPLGAPLPAGDKAKLTDALNSL